MTKTKVRIVRYGLYGLLIFALLSLIGYGLVIRPLQIRQQKQNFAKAESSLDALEKQIEATIGKPDAIKKEKSCSYASRVYEKGPLGCSVGIYLLFSNKDSVEATKLMKSVASHNGGGTLQIYGNKNVDSFIDSRERHGEQVIKQSGLSVKEISCSTQYSYPVLKNLSQQITPISAENILIELSCGGSAMAEYYPVNK